MVLWVGWPASSRAEDVAVPIAVQAALLVKLAVYDRNLPARAGDRVRVFIVAKHGDADSQRAAAQMQSALADVGTIANLPHTEVAVDYASASALAERCRVEKPAIVFFTPGFANDVPLIRAAFDGIDVLTIAAIADYVRDGIVLGFDLVSGKPKLVGNLAQARRQHVDFGAEVLRLMILYR